MSTDTEGTAVFSFDDEATNESVQVHQSIYRATQPIDIPVHQRNSSQRHTNFTPPRSYNLSDKRSAVLSLHSMTRAGSIPKHLTLAYHLDVSLDLQRYIEAEAELHPIDWRRHSLLSEPTFRMNVVERDIGRDLRVMSDIFHMQSAGFAEGYEFVDRRDPIRYSSSFPGSTRCRMDRDWQRIIQAMSPTKLHCPTMHDMQLDELHQ